MSWARGERHGWREQSQVFVLDDGRLWCAKWMLLFHLVLITLLALNVKVLFGMTGIMTPSTAQLATQPTEGNKINRGPWYMLAQLNHQRIQRETQWNVFIFLLILVKAWLWFKRWSKPFLILLLWDTSGQCSVCVCVCECSSKQRLDNCSGREAQAIMTWNLCVSVLFIKASLWQHYSKTYFGF